jgi:F0F1-type ATP synthase assembly protein I
MVFLGKWLDDKFGTSPIWIVTCSIFGVFAGLYTFLKTVIRLDKEKKAKK